MSQSPPTPTPSIEGIASVLDTDLYKLTMQCVIHARYPATEVSYAFTNRTPHMRLNQEAFSWLEGQVSRLAELVLSEEEYAWLGRECAYLQRDGYLEFLRGFRFRPGSHVRLRFVPVGGGDGGGTGVGSTGDGGEWGDLSISVEGLWRDTILYEIPLLALVSEAYFKCVDREWDYGGPRENAYGKAEVLLRNGCVFSEFGSRRRRDYKTQDLVMQGLTQASKELANSQPGKLGGTSNVHFAFKYGVSPVGTVAHEWFMGIAAASGNYQSATEVALGHWVHCFGRGVLAIALTDTFGTPTFLEAFARPIPKDKLRLTEMWPRDSTPRYADEFAGVRQDSGDPKEFIKTMHDFYEREGIKGPKSMVFSDALNVERCLEYKKLSEEAGFKPSFGIGTFLTNDFKNPQGQKSEPMNIVIKLSSANGRPAVKLSDDMGKNTGDSSTVQSVKEALGYVDKKWADESSRWSGAGGDDGKDST